MASEKMKLFWLGIFIILTILILAWLLLLLRPKYGDEKNTLTVRFSNIEGISVGTQVNFAGKPVGQVDKIQTLKEPRDKLEYCNEEIFFYELTLKVDSSVSIYTYDEIEFSTVGLLGERTVAILPKATPCDSPPAINITGEVLYGQSTDQLQSILTDVAHMARTLEVTMESVNEFLSDNQIDLSNALNSFTNTFEKMGALIDRAHDMEVIDAVTNAADALCGTMLKANQWLDEANNAQLITKLGNMAKRMEEITFNISTGEGSLGKMVSSDCLYTKICTALNCLEMVMNDIHNYGLLFQYNKKWQRTYKKCSQ